MTNRNETVPALLRAKTYSFEDLCTIVELLRGENGCPWDREQTHARIRRCMIEEAYEVVEAIDRDDPTLLCEELGDVLFQVVFHAELEREQGRFSVGDVVTGIARKMIGRHPHVFGDETTAGSGEALQRWEEIKIREKGRRTLSSRLRAIPPMLPALLRAQKVREKLRDTSDEENAPGVGAVLHAVERFAETPGPEALGLLLYETVGLAAACGLDAEEALMHTTEQVICDAERAESEENI